MLLAENGDLHQLHVQKVQSLSPKARARYLADLDTRVED
jgi:hypothetical protein